MSVLIKGMEMPKDCLKCPFCLFVDGYWKCLVDGSHADFGGTCRPQNCPLVQVHTPHGRLIDADARVNVQLYNDEFEDYQTVNMSIDDLLDSSWIELEDDPTIIPASEEGE